MQEYKDVPIVRGLGNELNQIYTWMVVVVCIGAV